MKSELSKKLLSSILAVVMAVSMAPVSTVYAEEGNAQIVNGDFETGDLTGWTLLDGSSASENSVGVISNASTYWCERNF